MNIEYSSELIKLDAVFSNFVPSNYSNIFLSISNIFVSGDNFYYFEIVVVIGSNNYRYPEFKEIESLTINFGRIPVDCVLSITKHFFPIEEDNPKHQKLLFIFHQKDSEKIRNVLKSIESNLDYLGRILIRNMGKHQRLKKLLENILNERGCNLDTYLRMLKKYGLSLD